MYRDKNNNNSNNSNNSSFKTNNLISFNFLAIIQTNKPLNLIK